MVEGDREWWTSTSRQTLPLTPFHLGPALLLGVLLSPWLDLPALLAGSVVVDVRAALVVFGPLGPPVHGALTTFAGGTVVALAVAGGVLALPASVEEGLEYGRLADTGSKEPVRAGAVAGVYSHAVLDPMLYADARPSPRSPGTRSSSTACDSVPSTADVCSGVWSASWAGRS